MVRSVVLTDMVQIVRNPSDAPDRAVRRRLIAMRLHEIEGNPLSADEVAMFDMFERERWSAERRRAYILAKARPLAAE